MPRGASSDREAAVLVRSAQLATVGNLVRGMAHEINTPLGALASNHDVTLRALERLERILEDEKVTEDELDEVRRIVRAVKSVQVTNEMAVARMKHLVKSFGAFGRPDRSEIDVVDLRDLVRGTLELLQHELAESISVHEDLHPISLVECYPQQVNHVLMHLLMNAIQAMPEGGRMTLRTGTEGDGVAVEIEDTGVGIPAESLSRIFEPGFTTKGARRGLGLGLLISSEIVDRHGGSISVRSTVGRGSTFTLRFPTSLPTIHDRNAEATSAEEVP